jgi:hypothetical protein
VSTGRIGSQRRTDCDSANATGCGGGKGIIQTDTPHIDDDQQLPPQKKTPKVKKRNNKFFFLFFPAAGAGGEREKCCTAEIQKQTAPPATLVHNKSPLGWFPLKINRPGHPPPPNSRDFHVGCTGCFNLFLFHTDLWVGGRCGDCPYKGTTQPRNSPVAPI